MAHNVNRKPAESDSQRVVCGT